MRMDVAAGPAHAHDAHVKQKAWMPSDGSSYGLNIVHHLYTIRSSVPIMLHGFRPTIFVTIHALTIYVPTESLQKRHILFLMLLDCSQINLLKILRKYTPKTY